MYTFHLILFVIEVKLRIRMGDIFCNVRFQICAHRSLVSKLNGIYNLET
jgi:hypothetical protein